jgi:hypothetical protein
MIPRNQQNRKLRINLSCPVCGMNLDNRKTQGFVVGDETFCCKGCAEGTGCTCEEPRFKSRKAGNRPGDLGQRNLDAADRAKHTAASPRRRQSHETVSRDQKKLSRGVAKKRPSTRDVSRGSADFRSVLQSKKSVRSRKGVVKMR